MDEKKKGFSILAILVGGVVIYFGQMLLGIITNMLLFGISPLSAFGHHSHSVKPIISLPSMAITFMVAWVLTLVMDAFIAVAGGAVAGSLAPASKAEHGLLAGLGVSLVSFLLLLHWLSANNHTTGMSARELMASYPSLILYIIVVLFAWLGGRMAAGGSDKRFQGN